MSPLSWSRPVLPFAVMADSRRRSREERWWGCSDLADLTLLIELAFASCACLRLAGDMRHESLSKISTRPDITPIAACLRIDTVRQVPVPGKI